MCGNQSSGINALGNYYNQYTPPKEKPEEKLARLLLSATDTRISPVVLRLFLVAHWSKVSKLAHEIHDGARP